MLCIFFYFVGTGFLEWQRYFSKDSHWLEEWGRIKLVLSLVCFYLRLLNMFAVSRALGPKIKMIWHMWDDLRVIVAILIVLMVAFAVSFRSLVASRNGPEFSFYELRDIVAKSWWPLFGEFSSNYTENLLQNCNSADKRSYDTNSTYCHEFSSNYTKNLLQNCTSNASYAHSNVSNATEGDCPMTWSAATALVLQGLFVMFTSLLLFNLLIAMFKYAVLTIYLTVVHKYNVLYDCWMYMGHPKRIRILKNFCTSNNQLFIKFWLPPFLTMTILNPKVGTVPKQFEKYLWPTNHTRHLLCNEKLWFLFAELLYT